MELLRYFALIALSVVTSYNSVLGQNAMNNVDLFTQQDTMRAVEHLFQAKRTGGTIYMGVGIPLTLIGAATSFLVTTLTTTIKAGDGKEKSGPIILVSSGVGLLPSTVGLVRRIRFGRNREAAILRAYQDGQPLPNRIQRRLKTKFFW